MKLHKNRFFTLLLRIVLLCPMVAGNSLHLFFGCSEKNCSQAIHQSQSETACSHGHSSHHQNTDSKPITTDKNPCFICKFLAIPRVAPVSVVWNPEILLLENRNVVFPSFHVATYQNFEFGRAPPFLT